MKELVVISGKGGTGKTSLSAALIALLSKEKKLIAVDCDVDAADLHLVLAPELITEETFSSGYAAEIIQKDCTRCGRCMELCRFDGIEINAIGEYTVLTCEGCGVCFDHCPAEAITFKEEICGLKRESKTAYGPLFHAQLYPGAENSGKLVSLLKKEANKRGAETGCELILCDGSPGITCPVIASLAGASAVLIVSEPSLSGLHDLKRVWALCRQFKVPGFALINKADIHSEQAELMAKWCTEAGLPLLARLPWIPTISAAQRAGVNIVEYIEENPAIATKEDRAFLDLLKNLAGEVMERLWTR